MGRPLASWTARLLLLFGGVAAGLLLGEAVMRLVYRQPAVVMDMEQIKARVKKFTTTPARREGAFNLGVVGDSVVEGVGAPRGQGVAEVLGRRLGQATGAAVSVVNRGRSGATLEQKVELARDLLVHRAADTVVVVLFSDDLHTGAVVARHGVVVDLLDKQPSLVVRTLVRRSYVANALWMLWRGAVYETRTQFLSARERGRLVAMLGELRHLAQRKSVPLVMAILPASGMALCPGRPDPGTGCSWALLTMETMARMLQDAGLPFVDLRLIWADGKPRAPQIELDDMASGKLAVAVHPDAEGHAMIAEALLPLVRAAMLKRP